MKDCPSPQELGLPFKEWRKYQFETILEIVSSDKKIKLVEAPTGSGKSGVAVGAARMIGADRTIICCSTIQLQEQYLVSYQELVSVMGRGNFPCLIDTKINADEAVCTMTPAQDCPKFSTCPYHVQRSVGLSAPISVLNYAYFLRAQKSFGDLDLFFGDEAHELDSQLRGVVEARITINTFNRMNIALPRIQLGDPLYQDIQAWKNWASTALSRLPSKPAKEDIHFGLPPEQVKYIRRLISIHNSLNKIVGEVDDDWLVEKPDLAGNIVFKPVWAARYANDYIFKHSESVVLMSATFLGKEHVCRDLGLDENEVDYISVPSTFPKENRPIYLRPVVKVGRKMSGSDLADLIKAVDNVLDKYPDKKGLVHTTNYELVGNFQRLTRHYGRVITHRSGRDRVETLSMFKDSSLPLVLASPSMMIGVDLPEDQARFVITLKLPFPNLGDETVKRRMKLDPNGFPNKRGSAWYQWDTACKLVQSFGRGVRSPTDKCDQWVLDANIKWFIPSIRSILPEWVKEAMVWDQDPEEALRLARAERDWQDYQDSIGGES